MAKILNHNKILVDEHRHHHQRHHQQQQQFQRHYYKQPPCKQRQQPFESLNKICNQTNANEVCNKKYSSTREKHLLQHVALAWQCDEKNPQCNSHQTTQKDFQQNQANKNISVPKQLDDISHHSATTSQPHVSQHNYLNKSLQLTSNVILADDPFHLHNQNIDKTSLLPLGSYTSHIQCVSLLSPLTSSSTLAANRSSSVSTNQISTTNIPATTSTYQTACSVLTYNIFAAYAEAATLQLKRKTSFHKLLHVGSRRHTTDMRSICYLILMAFVYWSVMIRAAVATNVTASSTATTKATATATATTTIIMRPLDMELSSNITISSRPINVSKNGHGLFGGRDVDDYFAGVNSNNSSSISNSNNHRLQQHFPVTSVSSDILTNYQRRLLTRREAANVPDFDDDDSSYHDDDFDEYELLIRNKSAKGKYIGAHCNNMTCEPTLLHVTCDKESQLCGCEKNYPVQLGLTRGCDKPKKLGEQCFYDETCQYNDENSLCVQVRHNAMCQCANGFHSVSYTKPTRRVFCTQDLDELNSDLPTLMGVCVGIGVLAGLICMVLHLFSKTKYPRHRNFGDANLPPPIMYSSETGIPLTVQSGRPSSRSSIRSSGGSIGSYGNRRSSTGGVNASSGSKGILVSTSRTGSRRPSLASVHSTSSSVRSYSMMRFEKEQQQKEIRQEMKLRLARLQQHQQQQHLGQYKPQIIIGDTALSMQHGVALGRITMATPSPMTPNSMDELLPSVDENQEYPPKLQPILKSGHESVASATISAIRNVAVSTGTNPKLASSTTNVSANSDTGASAAIAASTATDISSTAAYIGPCSSSTEAL